MNTDNYEKSKEKWIKTLRVGDIVCDCRELHLSIKTIELEYCPRFTILRRLIWYLHMDWLDEYLRKVPRNWFSKFFSEVCDAHITLTDGNSCSAFHCCDPVDHSWEHEVHDE